MRLSIPWVSGRTAFRMVSKSYRRGPFGVVFLWLTAVMLFCLAGSRVNADRPNVLVVMTDDQGYGELSCHGNPILQTPYLDRLASQSLRLTDFHVAPMCTPTRGQLMTGIDALRNGAMNVSSGRTLLRPELKTMADVFRSAGYRTGLFGKWHLGDNYPFRPEDRGFDEAVWFPSSHIDSVPDFWNNDYFDDTYIHNTQRQAYDGYCSDVFFREAMSWIKGGDEDVPFFAYIPLNAPHGPWFVPDAYRAPIEQTMRERPEVVEHLEPEKRARLVSYLAMCANIDENVGGLNAFLEKAGLSENTILVFLTDNGSTMGPDYFNAGMRGKKVTLWEGGHRVPCFIRWPQGGFGEPRDVAELTQVQDLLPTLAALADVDAVPSSLDGINLAPLLRGERESLDDRMLVINYSRMPFRNTHYTPDNQAVPRREGAAVLWKHWRLLEDRELYDLRSDPHQDVDVASGHPDVVARMRAHLNSWWDGVKEKVNEPQRVVIGSEAENPLRLTACEWFDVFVDQQRQIRMGDRRNGVWHLEVDQPGRYRFDLRRWPAESGVTLHDKVPALQVTDGEYVEGVALPIAQARLTLGETTQTARPDADQQLVRFAVDLEKGPVELQTWMLDADGNEICGAYYVTVTRL